MFTDFSRVTPVLKRTLKLSLAFALSVFLLAPRGAWAAEALNTQAFTPTEDGGNFVNTFDTEIVKPYGLNAGLFLNFSADPLIEVDPFTKKRTSITRGLTSGDLLFSMAVHDMALIGIGLPLHYKRGYDQNTGDFSSGAYPGDLRARIKLQLLKRENFPVGLALIPTFTFPTGNEKQFLGNDGMTGGGVLAVDRQIPGFWEAPILLSANLGFVGRKLVLTQNQNIGSELNFSFGSNVPLPSKLEWITELYGKTVAAEPFQKIAGNPLELELALRSRALEESLGTVLTAGGGPGLSKGIGSPAWRVFVGVTYAYPGKKPVDRDQDTIADKDDDCPLDPEDFDQYRDEDGCPDLPITLRGSIVDAETGDSLVAEVELLPDGWHASGKQYEFVTEATGPRTLVFRAPGYVDQTMAYEGAPGFVTDFTARMKPARAMVRGRISDAATGSPVEGEVQGPGDLRTQTTGGEFSLAFSTVNVTDATLVFRAKGFDAKSIYMPVYAGLSTDVSVQLNKSIVKTKVLGQVIDAENQAGVAADITSASVPNVKVDPKTGRFEYTITGTEDTITVFANGYLTQVTQVTAAEGSSSAVVLVRLKRKQVEVVADKLVLDPIYFAPGKAKILFNSYSILDSVDEYLKKNPEVKLRIEGHTDNQGTAAKNLVLSKKRVQSVIDYLEQRGISKKRLEGRGFGSQVPIASNDTPEGMAKNRRVEFVIVTGDAPK